MLKLGLTGGIGAGKSTVARRLADLGAVVIDADRLAREVVAPGSAGLEVVVDVFGTDVLAPDGSLDRARLGAVVFADPQARQRLNDILHPRIAVLTAERLAALPDDAIAVHDVPLLVENRMGADYHLVIVVHAPIDQRVHRLVTERGIAEQDARSRAGAQADDDARRAAADVWLDNSGAPGVLRDAVDRLWADRITPFAENLRARRAAPRPDPEPVVPADPTWPAQAARLAARIMRAAGALAVRVDHVGPTALPDKAAPDVLDLRLVVDGPDGPEAGPVVGPALEAAGFIRQPPGQVYRAADPGRAVNLTVG